VGKNVKEGIKKNGEKRKVKVNKEQVKKGE
jgi:hypothetical protein